MCCQEGQRPLLSRPGSTTTVGTNPGPPESGRRSESTADRGGCGGRRPLLAVQTLGLRGAALPPLSWPSLCLGLRKSQKWRGFIIIKPQAPAACAGPIPEKVRKSGAGSCPRTWPAGPGQVRSGGRPAQEETFPLQSSPGPLPRLGMRLLEALLAPRLPAEGKLLLLPLRHAGIS